MMRDSKCIPNIGEILTLIRHETTFSCDSYTQRFVTPTYSDTRPHIRDPQCRLNISFRPWNMFLTCDSLSALISSIILDQVCSASTCRLRNTRQKLFYDFFFLSFFLRIAVSQKFTSGGLIDARVLSR